MSGDNRLAEYQARLQSALEAMQKMRARLEAVESRRTEPIAVIGIGCRFPGNADDPDSYWKLLIDGEDAIREIPAERWNIDSLYDPDPQKPGKMSARWGGFLKDVDQFDAQFFGISPREARSMDPQQRLLLEVSWSALENAGQNPAKLNGSQTGVFVGITVNDYLQLQNTLQTLDQIDAYRITGNSLNSAAGRLSYSLGFHGPSLAVDTACSSSLVAVHLACQSLRNGESSLALAGGVNLILSPELSIGASKASMLAPDGRCKTFDARADGFVRSEGCGVVVLKRLSDAQVDGDNILAVIRGSAVNQDGFSSGLTVPNKLAQEAVIRTALKNAGVNPGEIGYVEAHGTGTSLGDPIEVRALSSVLAEGRDVQAPFWLGSVKTNIGHTESAAGIAGLIKTVLILHHGVIPPHLHFQTPTPMIDWDKTPAVIPTQPVQWSNAPRFASVSAFGASGTNAHAVLASPPKVEETIRPVDRPFHILTISARNSTGLKELAERIQRYLANNSESLSNICYTLNTGRAHFHHRLALTSMNSAEMQEQLADFLKGEHLPAHGVVNPENKPKIAFLFTGHGSQYMNMGRALYDQSPVFQQAVQACEILLQDYLDVPISRVMYPSPDEQVSVSALWDGMKYTQPAQFVLAYALVRLWESWGIRPAAVIGHSVGEYAAACAAGVLTLADGIKLVAARGRLMDSLPEQGLMMAVFADEATVAKAIAPYAEQVAIAVINGPTSLVISGNSRAIEAIQTELAKQEIKTKRLDVAQASHSPLVDPMLDEFEDIANTIKFGAPAIEYISSLFGNSTTQFDSKYWRSHQRQAVRYADGLRTLLAQGYNHLIEIGPNPTLITIAQRNLEEEENPPVYYASLRKGQDDWAQMLNSLAGLYAQGIAVDWLAFDQPYSRRRLALPTYPFQRQSYWIIPGTRRQREESSNILHPLLGTRLRSAAKETIFETEISSEFPAFLNDHTVAGQVILPATAYVEVLIAAGHEVLKDTSLLMEGLVIHAPLQLFEKDMVTMQTLVTWKTEVEIECQVFSYDKTEDTWRMHASAVVRAIAEESKTNSPAEVQARCNESIQIEAHYHRLAERGLEFGPSFRGVTRLWKGKGEALARIEAPESVSTDLESYHLHPAILDAGLQSVAVLMPPEQTTYLPLSVDSMKVFGRISLPMWSHAVLDTALQSGEEIVRANLEFFDEDGNMLAIIDGFTLKQVSHVQVDSWLYEVQWENSIQAASISAHDLAGSLNSTLSRLAEDPKIVTYHSEFQPRMDTLCFALIQNALIEMGWSYEAGSVIALDQVLTQLGVVQQHRSLLNRFLEILEQEGVLVRVENNWQVSHPIAILGTAELAEELRSIYPDAKIEVDMVERIGLQLAGAIQGRYDPLELLFPNGSMDEAGKLYSHAPLTQNFNDLVAQAVRELRGNWPTDRPIKILEIGAGTGGTTAFVLEVLSSVRVEYTFSDISPSFLNKAKQKFAAYDFLQYRTFDIEQDPLSQGLELHCYDLILATNVLHATSDLRRTMKRVRELLSPEGLLLAVEGTRKHRFADIVVGLTPGWWAFTDQDLRPSYALLGQSQWLGLLEESGFVSARGITGESILSNQTLLIAQNEAIESLDDTRSWLVFAGNDPISNELIEKLRDRHQNVTCVRTGGQFDKQPGEYRVNAICAEDYKKLIEETGNCNGVLFLWALSEKSASPMEQSELCGGLLYLTQALVAAGQSCPLWIITRGAVAAGKNISNPHPSTMWGLSKVINQEHPELTCRAIDLDWAVSDEHMVNNLWKEISAPSSEDQIAYRQGQRLIPRLVAVQEKQKETLLADPVKLTMSAQGVLDNLIYQKITRQPPASGEVEIQVLATGIGFRDVLNTLGMYPGAGELGSECAGIVTAIGEGVDNVQVGDGVVAVALGSFASYVNTPARYAVRKPSHLSFPEAATIPSAFLTTHYALHTLAKLKSGERVLIHAAAGGVGLAAVQLAQQAGAEIFATAGSPAKRAMLKSLGIQHVMNSRTLDFANEIQQLTNNQGVDIVLNSLADEFIPKSISVLAENGRFIEIGKRGIWSEDQFAQLKPRAFYAVVDLLLEAKENENLVPDLFEQLMPAFENGSLQPLPLRAYPAAEVVDAFRFMAQGNHTGKLVITQETKFAIREDAAYLITGGLGGLGLAVAEWLAGQRARHVVLVGRTAPNEAALDKVQKLMDAGVEVVILQADISQRESVIGVLDTIEGSMPPLKGVIHAAGVLNDGTLSQQSWESFSRVFAPKVQGGWHLHELTKGMALDFFVLFSSAVSLIGSAGQANHVAASTFIDMLAHYRRLQGLPGLSIGWGPWEQIGAAAEREVAERLKGRGIDSIHPARGIEALSKAMSMSQLAYIGIIPVNWERFLSQASSPFFAVQERQLRTRFSRSKVPTKQIKPDNDLWRRLEEAPESKRKNLVLDHVRKQAMKVLNLPMDFPMEQRQPLQELGLDSLMAVELRNLLGKGLPLSRPLPATLVFDYPTPEAMTRYLMDELFVKTQAVVQPASERKTIEQVTVADLSEAEAEALLLAELNELRQNKSGKQT